MTWNVNSRCAPLPRVLELLARHRPDVVCLQETKSDPAGFPTQALAEAGYESVHHSAGRWAGVAILARAPVALAVNRAAALSPGPLLIAGGSEHRSGRPRRLRSPRVRRGDACQRSRAGGTRDAARHRVTRHLPPPAPRRGAVHVVGLPGHFHKGLGLRIDLALLSAGLAPGLRACGIDRNFRKGQKPSDHAPLLVDIDLPPN